MPPAIVHRHSFSFREATAALLGDEQVDADSYEIRVIGSVLVVDLVNPRETARIIREAIDEVIAEDGPVEDAGRLAAEKIENEYIAGGEPIDTGGLDAGRSDPDGSVDDRQKGGPLAQRAGIVCSEKAFWQFMEERTQEGAVEALRNACGVRSRSELDHNESAARAFKNLMAEYGMYLRG